MITNTWSQSIRHDNVLLFLSDAAPYMMKSGKSNKALYSKTVLVTYVMHVFHRVAEEVYITCYVYIFTNIQCKKKFFLKAPSRTRIFKNKALDIPMPPQPILTRWGTWLVAINYYCENYEVVKNIINKLGENDASHVQKIKEMFNNPHLK